MTKKKPYKSKTPEPSKAEEPLTRNHPNKITFFSSFEEMNEYDIREMAKKAPLENLQQMTAFIEHMFAEELKEPFSDFKIHFKQ